MELPYAQLSRFGIQFSEQPLTVHRLEAGAHQYQEQSEDVSMQPPKPAPADEASLIEERRKRREAIKAKYKGQATPLLVQALQLGNDSEAQTPMADTPVIRSERSGELPLPVASPG